jgi:hypothetical protein
MPDNWLSNRIFKSYADILDHCCFAWNRLVHQPWPRRAAPRRSSTMPHQHRQRARVEAGIVRQVDLRLNPELCAGAVLVDVDVDGSSGSPSLE